MWMNLPCLTAHSTPKGKLPTGNGTERGCEQTPANICDASGRFETLPDRRRAKSSLLAKSPVSDGGQAIVGTVNQAPRDDVLPEKTPNATPALTDARQTEMEIVGERKRKPVPQRRRHTDD